MLQHLILKIIYQNSYVSKFLMATPPILHDWKFIILQELSLIPYVCVLQS